MNRSKFIIIERVELTPKQREGLRCKKDVSIPGVSWTFARWIRELAKRCTKVKEAA